MRLDLKKHKLLGIIIGQTLKFDSEELPANEPMGVSFETILSELNCDMIRLNLIAAELYMEKEITYHDNLGVKGLSCIHNGTIAYSNSKYRRRFWADILHFLKELVQIIVPVLSLIVAIFALILSSPNKDNIHNMQLLKEKIEILQTELSSQTKEIQSLHETISLRDSLTHQKNEK